MEDSKIAKARVEGELASLEDKIDKLKTFINSDKFNQISDIQCSLLTTQYAIMKAYFATLRVRLLHWEG